MTDQMIVFTKYWQMKKNIDEFFDIIESDD